MYPLAAYSSSKESKSYLSFMCLCEREQVQSLRGESRSNVIATRAHVIP